MVYDGEQLDDLARTIRAVECDVVVTGTPVGLARLVDVGHPLRHATYELSEIGHPDLVDALRTRIAGLGEGSSVPGEGLRFRRE